MRFWALNKLYVNRTIRGFLKKTKQTTNTTTGKATLPLKGRYRVK